MFTHTRGRDIDDVQTTYKPDRNWRPPIMQRLVITRPKMRCGSRKTRMGWQPELHFGETHVTPATKYKERSDFFRAMFVPHLAGKKPLRASHHVGRISTPIRRCLSRYPRVNNVKSLFIDSFVQTRRSTRSWKKPFYKVWRLAKKLNEFKASGME